VGAGPPNTPEIRNPKIEIRNKSEIQKANVQNALVPNLLDISYLKFEFVSDFGFRVSDFWPSRRETGPTMPDVSAGLQRNRRISVFWRG
jgi:hypothetical protein